MYAKPPLIHTALVCYEQPHFVILLLVYENLDLDEQDSYFLLYFNTFKALFLKETLVFVRASIAVKRYHDNSNFHKGKKRGWLLVSEV